MTLQKINIGAVPNDGTGDNNRAAWQKVNAAFAERGMSLIELKR